MYFVILGLLGLSADIGSVLNEYVSDRYSTPESEYVFILYVYVVSGLSDVVISVALVTFGNVTLKYVLKSLAVSYVSLVVS